MSEQPNSKPKKTKKAKPYSSWRTFGLVTFITFKWIVYFSIFFALLAGGALTGYVAALVKDEDVRSREMIMNKISENSITGYVYFNDDSLVGQLRTDEDRSIVTYEELPPQVINAVLAVEDNNFKEHIGIDINGLGRAVKQKLFNEDTQTGGSTLTQQLARRVFLNLDKTDSRKVKEIFLSMRMERYLTKEEILTAYLNKVPFGNGSSGYNLFGIKAAAKGIFGISDLNQLNVAQAAYLAGLPQRPSAYTAFNGKGNFNEDGFKLAVQRQQTVLSRMLDTGRISQEQYGEAKRFDIRATLAEPAQKAYTTYPYLMLEAERQAAEVLLLQQNNEMTVEELRKSSSYAADLEEAREMLLSGGYHIYTTIDKDIYQIMRDIASNEDNFSPYSEEKGLEQIAAMLIDHKTGAVLSMLEGRDFYEEQMNFATQMTRQPGSTLKTLAAYLPAIEEGIIQPGSIVDDSPIVLKDGQKGFHIPMNVTRTFNGLVTARDALNRSMNIPALKIFNEDVTIEKAWEFVRELGITTLQPEDAYSQTGVIGGLRIGVSVEELTSAYGSIPNNGVYNDSYMIAKITDDEGKIVYEHKMESKRVFSEQSAFLITDMLQTVISGPGGSGAALKSQFKQYGKVPIAGKTGSTQSYGDVWFMGFTPDVTLGVWAGYEEQINSLSNNGRKRAINIWGLIMNELTEKRPDLFAADSFNRPEGIVKATVSGASGLLPNELSKQTSMLVTDWFNQKFIPKEIDESLVKMAVVTYKDINYVPNEATPSDMTTEKIVIKRKKPLDELMDEITQAQEKLPASSRRAMSVYVPKDAAMDAPSKVDPREDDGAAPPPPGNVKLTGGGNELTISFSASSAADVLGYRIYRSINSGPFEKIGASILSGSELSSIVAGSDSQQNSYYVTAVDVVGNESAPSQMVEYGMPIVNIPGIGDNTDGQTPPNPDEGQLPGDNDPSNNIAVPAAPVGLKASKGDLSVVLSWSANSVSEQVTQYHVYYSSNNDGKYTKIGSTAETSFEYVGQLISGSFFVIAENAAGQSVHSASVTAEE